MGFWIVISIVVYYSLICQKSLILTFKQNICIVCQTLTVLSFVIIFLSNSRFGLCNNSKQYLSSALDILPRSTRLGSCNNFPSNDHHGLCNNFPSSNCLGFWKHSQAVFVFDFWVMYEFLFYWAGFGLLLNSNIRLGVFVRWQKTIIKNTIN